MFKKISVLALAASLTTVAVPTSSDAALGVMASNPGLVVVGAVVGLVGLATPGHVVVTGGKRWVVSCVKVAKPCHHGHHHGHHGHHPHHGVCYKKQCRGHWVKGGNATTHWVSGGALLVLGIVLMDGEAGDTAFGELTEETANEIGDLSDAEIAAWNAKLPEINAVRESITAEIATIENPAEQEKLAQARWAEAALDAELGDDSELRDAYTVLKAVASEMLVTE